MEYRSRHWFVQALNQQFTSMYVHCTVQGMIPPHSHEQITQGRQVQLNQTCT